MSHTEQAVESLESVQKQPVKKTRGCFPYCVLVCGMLGEIYLLLFVLSTYLVFPAGKAWGELY